MTPFDQTLAGWHDFYIMVGTAAATLVGLLFIAASLHVSALRRPDQSALFSLVYQSFSNFLNVLLISAIFLMPQAGPNGVGYSLIVVSALGIAERAIQYLKSNDAPFRSGTAATGSLRIIVPLVRLYIPIAAYVALIIVAVGLLNGSTGGLYWIVLILLALIFSGARTAFILMIWDETMPTGGQRSPKP